MSYDCICNNHTLSPPPPPSLSAAAQVVESTCSASSYCHSSHLDYFSGSGSNTPKVGMSVYKDSSCTQVEVSYMIAEHGSPSSPFPYTLDGSKYTSCTDLLKDLHQMRSGAQFGQCIPNGKGQYVGLQCNVAVGAHGVTGSSWTPSLVQTARTNLVARAQGHHKVRRSDCGGQALQPAVHRKVVRIHRHPWRAGVFRR